MNITKDEIDQLKGLVYESEVRVYQYDDTEEMDVYTSVKDMLHDAKILLDSVLARACEEARH
ncbi:hypothetical protein FACS1894187_10480 [Synergistales bacterium]|nr:hypothetical protein FACS1894187_10480 [Synergistales bacterium]